MNSIINTDWYSLFSNQILKEIYNTHGNLNRADIEWAYMNSSNIVIIDPEINNNWPDLVLLILHGCKELNTGKLSFIYNFELDDAIKRRDFNKLQRLIKLPSNQLWLEKVNNTELSNDQQNELTSIRDTEMLAVMSVVNQGRNLKPPYINNFITVCNEDTISKNNTTIYSNCYKGVCIEQANTNKTKTLINNCKDGICNNPNINNGILDQNINNRYNIDKNNVYVSPDVIMVNVPVVAEINYLEVETRCYEFEVMLEMVSIESDVIDPYRKDKIPNDIVDILRDKYNKEIKLYRYFKQYRDNL